MADLVNRVFESMTAVCTAWRQAATGDPQAWAASYKRELLESLVRMGVTDEGALRRGVARLKQAGRDWLPNPEAFAALCHSPEDLGLPAEDAAYRMAVRWAVLPAGERHPAVLAALRAMDSWQFRRQPEAEARATFRRAWRGVVDRVRAEGHGWLPQIPAELRQHHDGSPEARSKAQAMLRKIKAGLGVGERE